MPETYFQIQWPNGTVEDCYCPSTIIRDFLSAPQKYTLGDFVQRSQSAMTAASARVESKYGFPCSRAAAQLAKIEATASQFPMTAHIMCLSMS